MSDLIKHECGIALIRLRKPLAYYYEKYGSPLYGLNKLYLLMEKQHNRGQDGAGVGSVKLNTEPGYRYISRIRSNAPQPIKDIFERIYARFERLQAEAPTRLKDAAWLKRHVGFTGEILMGHLRYGTHGGNSIEQCHPFLRQNNWKTRNLMLAGNFNMTNVDELFEQLVELGQFPKEKSDTVTVLEKIGHFMDVENQRIFDEYKSKGYSNRELSEIIADKMDLARLLNRAARDFDGGYTMVGLLGHGDAFVLRDPNSIRPAYWYMNDEVVVAASERPPIQTAFNAPIDKVEEIPGGHALIIKHSGKVSIEKVLEPRKRSSCSFERIYFSRGSDRDIYRERQQLGTQLVKQILPAVNYDLENTVFSFVPNTAEVAFYGMMKGLEDWLIEHKIKKIEQHKEDLKGEELQGILNWKPRVEKVTVKDVKMRTFITEDHARDELVSHVYDITYGSIRRNKDSLVIMDDSIVRGTTLKRSILSILDRLGPKKIIVVSSAPQIRYPDCYGIDMSKLGDFVAFRAAIRLLKARGMQSLIDEVYEDCKRELRKAIGKENKNHVQRIYAPFSPQEISAEIARIVRPEHIFSKVEIIYQSIEGLHMACPQNKGDWYFTGNYPTPGGTRVANKSFVYYMEGRKERAY